MTRRARNLSRDGVILLIVLLGACGRSKWPYTADVVALRDASTGAIQVRAGIFDEAGEMQSFEHFHVGVVSEVVVPGADRLLPAQEGRLDDLHNYFVTLPTNAVKRVELQLEFGNPSREWVLPVQVEIEPR